MDVTCKEAFKINFLVGDVNNNGWLTYNMRIHTLISDGKGTPTTGLGSSIPRTPYELWEHTRNVSTAWNKPSAWPRCTSSWIPGRSVLLYSHHTVSRRLNDTETLKSIKTTLFFHRLYLEKSLILTKIYSDASLMSWGTLNSSVPALKWHVLHPAGAPYCPPQTAIHSTGKTMNPSREKTLTDTDISHLVASE